MTYRQHHFTLRFLTPAFLGDAEQSGRWRTPPIKAQLRQWWRVAYAADKSFNVDVEGMRREEGLLFGNAWLSHREGNREVTDHRKGLVRLRLSRWDAGALKSWKDLERGTIHHPEVERTNHRVGPHAYLAYGALDGRSGTQFDSKRNAAIQANESANLSIAFPSTYDDPELGRVAEVSAPRIERALAFADLYGALGGRSRNGWGSFQLDPGEGTQALTGTLPVRDWQQCLDRDWPHAIGQDDGGPLIWQTRAHDDWLTLMKTLAIVKIGLRTQFSSRTGKDAPKPEERHWLSYPVTKHNVSGWREKGKGDFRLPNSLRFKVRRAGDGKLVGVIFHVPHLPPRDFRPDRQAIEMVWAQVHRFLDQPAQGLTRVSV